MTIWTDAHLSPAIAKWITENYPAQATALRDLGLRDALAATLQQALDLLQAGEPLVEIGAA